MDNNQNMNNNFDNQGSNQLNNNQNMNNNFVNQGNSQLNNNQNMNNNFVNQGNDQLNNGQNMNNNFNNQVNNQLNNNQNMNNSFNNQPGNTPNNSFNNQSGNASNVNNIVNKVKGNKLLTIGIGVVSVIILIVIMSSLFGGSSGKTLHCKQHTAIMGIVYDTDETYKIGEGKVNSAKIKFTYYLDQFRNVEGDLDAWATERISTNKGEFSKISGCNYKSDYSKNKKLVETITCDNTGYLGMGGTDFTGSTAEQIYNSIKSKKESDSTVSYTCE